MLRCFSTIALAFGAFLLGLFVAHDTPRAGAASAPVVARAVDLSSLTRADLVAPKTGTMRKTMFVDNDAVTVGVYMGRTARHYHANSDEFQYVVQGTGTEWFGTKRIALKPGMLLIIPRGMPHGGVSENVKLLEMKSPPQDPADNHKIE